MDPDRLAFLALHFIPGIGTALLKQLIGYCGSATEVLRQTRSSLLKIPGIGEATTKAIRSGAGMKDAERELKHAEKEGVQLLFYTDASYPQRLRPIDDAPTLLYVKGNINLNQSRTVGIVGTRKATHYGRACVEELLEGLMPHRVVIVSGLAYGIDIHAHKEALRHGMATVGVLGSGLDVIYPGAHRDTANRMTNQGALITENHFGAQPDAHHFPERNRIIAGLCDALVVVEASDKGGALITAEIANSYNRDVFAIPGNLHSQYSTGCNRLIKTHKANLLTSVADLEYIMNWRQDELAQANQLALELGDLADEERQLLTLLREKRRSLSIDELGYLCPWPQGQLSALLLSLEFKNRVISLPGKLYTLRGKGNS